MQGPLQGVSGWVDQQEQDRPSHNDEYKSDEDIDWKEWERSPKNKAEWSRRPVQEEGHAGWYSGNQVCSRKSNLSMQPLN